MRTASAKRRGADRHDHEFLEVDRVVGVRAAVDDVHHRHRQHARLRAADVAVERQARGLGRGLGDGQRDAEDRVGAEARLVRRAVELDQRLVDGDLILGIHAADRVEDLALTLSTALQHALAAVAALVAVAQLDRLVRAGARRRTARRRGRSEPSSRSTSTSTVGLPRLSRISRAAMSMIAVMMVLSQSVVEQRSASRSDLSDPDVVGVSGDREGDAGRDDHEIVGLGEFLLHRVGDGVRHHLLVGTHLVRPDAVRPPEQAEPPRGRRDRA